MAETPRASRARKGVARETVIEAALELIDREGEAAFGVRPLAAALGLDPMTVLHHVGSRERAVRAAADLLLARLLLPPPSADWRAELTGVATAFRALALRHPRAFPLLLRFAATGPADYAQGERVYAALLASGLPEPRAAQLGLAFYALVIGLSAAEVGGMLHPASDEEARELASLDPATHPASVRLAPAFLGLVARDVAEAGVGTFLDGVAADAGR
jgi:AcrR family transcriptional regulator